MTKRASRIELVSAGAIEVALADGVPAKRVKLLPMGQIVLRDGRGPYLLKDRAHAEAVVAATRDYLGAVDFMFDYDHQANKAARADIAATAPASGWGQAASLTVEDDGIWIEASWTPAATEKLVSREYRYVSPTFFAAEDSKQVLRLKNAALTCSPAIDLPAIAASTTGETMTLKAIAEAAGLGADASEDQIVAAIGTLKTSAVPIAVAAGLAETATTAEIEAAVATLKTAAKPDPARFVPIEQVTQVTAQLAILSAERAEREVAAAIAGGKLSPAMKGWGLDLFKKDELAWAGYLKSAPVIVAAGQQLGQQHKVQATTLTTDEIAACEMTGMSHADFLKAKNEEIG